MRDSKTEETKAVNEPKTVMVTISGTGNATTKEASEPELALKPHCIFRTRPVFFTVEELLFSLLKSIILSLGKTQSIHYQPSERIVSELNSSVIN